MCLNIFRKSRVKQSGFLDYSIFDILEMLKCLVNFQRKPLSYATFFEFNMIMETSFTVAVVAAIHFLLLCFHRSSVTVTQLILESSFHIKS